MNNLPNLRTIYLLFKNNLCLPQFRPVNGAGLERIDINPDPFSNNKFSTRSDPLTRRITDKPIQIRIRRINGYPVHDPDPFIISSIIKF